MQSFGIKQGCIVAMTTPFINGAVDWPGVVKNTEFLIAQKVAGVAPSGTTGESPALNEREHLILFGVTAMTIGKRKCFKLAGSGSNSTREMLDYLEAAAVLGYDGGLLVDCYYNGPSSLELRDKYYRLAVQLAAERYPQLVICPYVIPGRTGCALHEVDLAKLAWEGSRNVTMVKDATLDTERMRRTREITPEEFLIFSGDDNITFDILTDPGIRANGVVSVTGNIVGGAIQQMCEKVFAGKLEEAKRIKKALDPLFDLVTIKDVPRTEVLPTKEGGFKDYSVKDKFRNPDAIKTIMAALGMPSGLGRDPLDKMTAPAVEKVRTTLRQVWDENPWLLEPIQEFYEVKVEERLGNDKIWTELTKQEVIK